MSSIAKSQLDTSPQSLGGKGARLVELKTLGFPVPDFIVLPVDFSDWTNLDALVSEQFPNYNGLFAVRSSAVGEDDVKNSFAGQFLTRLNVEKAKISTAVKEVHASIHAPHVKAYCKQFNRPEPEQMAVIVQQMIEPETSGVAFGVHPILQDKKLVEAVWGLGEGLVSGALNSDSYLLSDNSKIEETIAAKEYYFKTSPNSTSGYEKVELPDVKKSKSCLTKEQIQEINTVLDRLNTQFGRAQDIEFCFVEDHFYLLQSRPVTVISNAKALDTDNEVIWDNSNIVESYPGISSPLTFSFVQKMYASVYRQFTSLMGVSHSEIEANASIFDNMLGLLKGRVYYNLLNWYNVLALLPGYRLNAPFMEKMMGVKESFDLPVTVKTKDNEYLRLGRTVFSLLKNMVRLPRMRRRFTRDFESIMQQYSVVDFSQTTARELLDMYSEFEQVLLKKWKAPLVNDFFAMIAFGLLQKLAEKYQISETDDLRNDLLIGSQDIISTEPIERCLALSASIGNLPKEKKRFLEKTAEEITVSYNADELHPDIQKGAKEYIEKWGDRCAGELKLETITYRESPDRFFKIIKSYVKNGVSTRTTQNTRKAAEETVAEKMKGKPFGRMLFLFLLRRTRQLVSSRENLRFARTRGFAMVRRIFKALGSHWQEQNLLDTDADIFFLELKEIQDFIGGTSTTTDLKSLVELRKKQQAKFTNTKLPERIRTHGTVYSALEEVQNIKEEIFEFSGKEFLSGTGCCPGEITAKARIVHDPAEVDNLDGDILVTVSTDPGWVLLFPTASAVIVEKGSLLSHSAIVCREMGIPCIVGVKNATRLLNSGELLRMNGRTGSIERIENG